MGSTGSGETTASAAAETATLPRSRRPVTWEMRRIVKTAGIVLSVLVALALTAALAVRLLFDPNDYKDELAAWVQDRTGREFVIEDDLELTFFPWLGVETGGIRLGNAEGFGNEEFAGAASATVRVRLFPLLSKRLEIGTLELEGLELNLAVDGEGRGNWEDLLDGEPGDGTEGPATASADTTLQDLAIAGINVRDGLIFWREDVTEVRYVISDLSLETGPIRMGQPVDTELDFQLVGVDPQFTATVGATTTATIDLDAARYGAEDLLLEFRLEDGRHEERATGRLASSLEYSAAEGALQLNATAFEAELTDPPMGPEQLSVRGSSELARLDLQSRAVELGGLTTTVGNIVAEWELTDAELTDAARLTGTMSIAGGSLEEAFQILGLERDDGSATDLGTFDLESGFVFDLPTRNLTLTHFEGSALEMAFVGEGEVNQRETTGSIQAPAFDPATLFSILPPATLEGINTAAIDELSIDAELHVNGANQVISLRNFNASIPGASVSGRVERLEDGGRLRGRLETSDMDPAVLVALIPDRLPRGLSPQRLGTVRLDTAFDYDVSSGQIEFDGLNAEAVGLQAEGALLVRDLSGSPRTVGNLQIQRFSPRALFNRFDQPVPVTSDDAVLGSAIIDTRVDIGADGGEFEEIRLQLDDTVLTGRFTVVDFNDPKYVFDIAVDSVDVDRYLPPRADDAGANPDEPKAGDLPLPTEPLNALALEGRVTVADLQMAGLSFSNVSTELFIADGLGRIDSARAELYGGEFEGGVELDARAGGPTLSLQGTAAAIDLEPLLTDLSGRSTVSGTGTLDLDLMGIGATVNDVLATAAGHVNFALRDGALQGFNLDHTLCDAYNQLKKLPRPAPLDAEFTRFSLMRGTTQVSDGIARTTDLVATTPSLQVTGQGQLDLVSQQIEYDVVAEMTDKIALDRCQSLDNSVGNRIPITVSGTISDPLPLPDLDELLREAARDAAREAVEDSLRDRLEELLRN